MIDFRAWFYARVRASAEIMTLVGDHVLYELREESPVGPFIVLRFDPEQREIEGVFSQDVTAWIHDAPTSYVRIDQLCELVRLAVQGPITDDGGIAARWTGKSADLVDDMRGTFVRTISFRLFGTREEEA